MHDGSLGTQTPPAVALSLVCIVLDLIQDLTDTTAGGTRTDQSGPRPRYVQPVNFYNETLQYSCFDRLGGVVSYLNKAYATELAQRLGQEQQQQEPETSATDVVPLMHLMGVPAAGVAGAPPPPLPPPPPAPAPAEQAIVVEMPLPLVASTQSGKRNCAIVEPI